MNHGAMSSAMEIDIYNTPAAPPPPGIVPDLKHPQIHDPGLLISNVLYLSFTSLAVTLRVFTKVHVMRQMKVEDCKLSLPLYKDTMLTSFRCVGNYAGSEPLSCIRIAYKLSFPS